MPGSSDLSIWTRVGRAPPSTMTFLFSSFLKARVRRAPAAARWTFGSGESSRETRGAIPPSALTRDLMTTFSWERLVMASAALRTTDAPGGGPPPEGGGAVGQWRPSRVMSPGIAPASAMAC